MKSLLRSKTFWLAIGQAAAGAAGLAVTQDPTVHAFSWAAFGKSAVDIGLRIVTKSAIGAE